jgi:hypothetical protein
VVRKEKLPLQIDYVESAIDGLQYELEGLGLVHERRVKKTERRKKAPDWLPPTLGQDSFTDLHSDEPEPAEAEQPEDNPIAAQAHPSQEAGINAVPSPTYHADTATSAAQPATPLTFHMTQLPVSRRMTMNLLIYKATAMMTPTFNARISGNNLIASLNDDKPIFPSM